MHEAQGAALRAKKAAKPNKLALAAAHSAIIKQSPAAANAAATAAVVASKEVSKCVSSIKYTQMFFFLP